jgi:tetratricopeptide (TPR) repeat protein
MSDAEDRKLRTDLRNLLNSVTIPFSQLQPVSVNAYVWSMPFRLATLQRRIAGRGVDQVVQDIVRETEEALDVLPLIEAAHEHEKNGALRDALEAYRLANSMVPRNTYLMRHLAKLYSTVGDFPSSLKWWNALNELDPNPCELR